MNTTQHDVIIRHLEEGGTLTVAEALFTYRVYALSQRIGELRRRGHPIKSEFIRTGGGALVKRYFLEGTQP